MTADQLKTIIINGLPCDHVAVQGDDGQHFEAVIVSKSFNCKSMLEQHQLVYAAIGDYMRDEIHALSMRTLTPDQWAKSTMK
ncbi:MAG: BolA/IbaG family iron-sulfur metabolism protein [Methylophaga sp.]|nr:BolA/IbaG family iron-sulfur metabolism protein [Methylophaga sp.]